MTPIYANIYIQWKVNFNDNKLEKSFFIFFLDWLAPAISQTLSSAQETFNPSGRNSSVSFEFPMDWYSLFLCINMYMCLFISKYPEHNRYVWYVCCVVLGHFSHVDSATLWIVAHQAPSPMVLQARILEWVAMPSSRGSFPPRDQTLISCVGR